MAKITVQNPENEEIHCIEEENYGEAYEGWAIIAQGCNSSPDDVIEDGQWVTPLSVLQDQKWQLVKAIRFEKENGVAPTPAGPIQIDEPSKAKIQGLLNMARLLEEQDETFSEDFTMADNSVVTLNSTSIRQVAAAAASYISQVYAHARTLRNAIYNEEITREQLEQLDIESGWPN